MIISSSSPLRISLFGGSTDIPSYYEKYGGVVISMAINLRTHIQLSTENDIWAFPGNTLPEEADPNLFYKISEMYGMNSTHLRTIRSTCDGKIGAGLGSSASAATALIAAFQKLKGLTTNPFPIAELAWDIEVNELGWYGGKQDQYAVACGGFNKITFDEKVKVYPFSRLQAQLLSEYLVLFDIGGRRLSKEIQKGFKNPTVSQVKHLHKIKEYVDIAEKFIQAGDMVGLGKLLRLAWEEKKKSNKGITNEQIDRIYDFAIQQGALGGKVLGAGGAGYMVFMVKPQYRQHFIKEMEELDIIQRDCMPDFQGIDVRVL